MERMKHHWQQVPAAIRKPLVLIVGVAIIAAGIGMLVLPGPGWAAIFLGFAVLATEFAFAERVRSWAVTHVKEAWEKFKAKRQARKANRQ